MDHCLEEVLQHVGHPDAGLSANGAENTGKVSIESPGVRTNGENHGSSSSSEILVVSTPLRPWIEGLVANQPATRIRDAP